MHFRVNMRKAGSEIKSRTHLLYRTVDIPLGFVCSAQPHTGRNVFRVYTENSQQQIDSFLVEFFAQATLPQKSVSLKVFRVVLEDVLSDVHGLIKSTSFDEIADLILVALQTNLSHCCLLSRRRTRRRKTRLVIQREVAAVLLGG